MFSDRFKSKIQELAREDVVRRHAEGPPTPASIASLLGESDFKIATFRTGHRALAIPNDPYARELREYCEKFRSEAALTRLESATPDRHRKNNLSRTQCTSLFEDFSRKLLDLAATSQLSQIRTLIEESSNAQSFIHTRAMTHVRAQFGALVQNLLEATAQVIFSIEKASFPIARHASISQEALDRLRSLVDSKRELATNFYRPGQRDSLLATYHFMNSREKIFSNSELGTTAEAAPIQASLLSRRLSRLFFARQAAMISVFEDSVSKYVAEPGSDSLRTLTKTLSDLLKKSKQSQDFALNPYTDVVSEVRGLLENAHTFVCSRHVVARPEYPAIGSVLKSLCELSRMEHKYQSWITPGVSLYSAGEQQQLQTSFDGVSGWAKRKYAESMIDTCGALLSFRYSGAGITGWRQFLDLDAPRTLFQSIFDPKIEIRAEKAINRLASIAVGCVEEYRVELEKILPKSDPLEVQVFRKDQGFEIPGQILAKVVDLELSNLAQDQGKFNLGFRTIVPLATLESRVQESNATIINIQKGDELIASYVLSADRIHQPKIATDLMRILRSYLETGQSETFSPDSPVLTCDLVVKKRGSEFLKRTHGEDPYSICHQQFLASVQAQYTFEPSVYCVGYCRVDNLAMNAHKRVGWQVVPDSVYVDEDGLKNHVLYMKISPLADLLAPSWTPDSERAGA